MCRNVEEKVWGNGRRGKSQLSTVFALHWQNTPVHQIFNSSIALHVKT
jgi:hypothetical protein